MTKYNQDIKCSPSERFVRDLYRGVLKREGEDNGVNFYKSLLGESPSFEIAKKLLSEFISSAEFSSLRVWRSVSVPNLNLIDHIFSLGSHCLTSSTLKKALLRYNAGPFDWIFSSISMISHCISDNFIIFLDRKYYRRVALEHRMTPTANVCEHMFYKDNYNIQFVFNHLDVTDSNNYTRLIRSVERFRAALSSGKRILLVGIAQPTTCPDDKFMELCKSLNEFPAVEILFFRAIEFNGSKFGVELALEQNQHKLFNFFMINCLGPTEFTCDVDEIMFRTMLEQYCYMRSSS